MMQVEGMVYLLTVMVLVARMLAAKLGLELTLPVVRRLGFGEMTQYTITAAARP